MADNRFHLGWFMNFTTNEWNMPFGNDGMPWNGKFYIEMAQAMEQVGGDGFLISTQRVSKQYITEICEGLIPALQRRGLTRTEYAHAHLRDTLREF